MGLLDGLIPGLSIAGDLIGTGINAWSQGQTNKQNEALQREEWAREDSSYQRKVADLKAAGLNPALALGGGGAPSSLSTRIAPVQVEAPNFQKAFQGAIAKSQQGIASSEEQIKANEVIVSNENKQAAIQEALARSERAMYDRKYYKYLTQHAESIAENDFQRGEFSKQRAAIDVNRGQWDADMQRAFWRAYFCAQSSSAFTECC